MKRLIDYLRMLKPHEPSVTIPDCLMDDRLPVFVCDDLPFAEMTLSSDYMKNVRCNPVFNKMFIESRATLSGTTVYNGYLVEDAPIDEVLPSGIPHSGGDKHFKVTFFSLGVKPGHFDLKGSLAMGGCQFFLHLYFDEYGYLLNPKELHAEFVGEWGSNAKQIIKDPLEIAQFTIAAAMSILHSGAEMDHQQPPRQAQRKHKRDNEKKQRRHHDLRDYYILKVGNKSPSESGQSRGPNKSKRREGLRRGHWRVYGQGNGLLFGKYEKTLWIPERNPAVHEIRKRYHLDNPAN